MSNKHILPRFTPSQTEFLCQLKAEGLPRAVIVDMFLGEHPHYFEIASEGGISDGELVKKIAKRVTSLGDSRRRSSRVISDYKGVGTKCRLERTLRILSHYVPFDGFDDMKELLASLREKSRLDALHELDYLKAVKMYVSVWTTYHNSVYKRLKAERDIERYHDTERGKSSSEPVQLELEDREDTSMVGRPAAPSVRGSDVNS